MPYCYNCGKESDSIICENCESVIITLHDEDIGHEINDLKEMITKENVSEINKGINKEVYSQIISVLARNGLKHYKNNISALERLLEIASSFMDYEYINSNSFFVNGTLFLNINDREFNQFFTIIYYLTSSLFIGIIKLIYEYYFNIKDSSLLNSFTISSINSSRLYTLEYLCSINVLSYYLPEINFRNVFKAEHEVENEENLISLANSISLDIIMILKNFIDFNLLYNISNYDNKIFDTEKFELNSLKDDEKISLLNTLIKESFKIIISNPSKINNNEGSIPLLFYQYPEYKL